MDMVYYMVVISCDNLISITSVYGKIKFMKIKQIFASAIVAGSTLSLFACNGGHQSLPTTNYGGLVGAPVAQNLLGFTDIPVAGPINNIMLYTGKYGESAGIAMSNPNFGKAIYAYESANRNNTLEDFNFNVGNIVTNAKAQTVKAYTIKYYTPGQNSNTEPDQVQRTASGLIIVPNGEIRGVVLYFHPTAMGKNQVPSCINVSSNFPSYCGLVPEFANEATGTGTFANLASIYASRGFAVVAPDYVGMGADWNNVHPYVAYPENNVLSGFYMFPALRQLIASNNPSQSNVKLPLMITGYSEGGAYALKGSQMAQGNYANLLNDNKLELKISSPQEGAYALKDQMNFAFEDLNDGVFNCSNNPSGSNFVCGESDAAVIDDTNATTSIDSDVAQMNNWHIVNSVYAAAAKPNLTGYVLTAAMYYSFHNLTPAYNFAMNPKFWQNIPILNTSVDLYNLFSGNAIKYNGSQIGNAILNNTMNIQDAKTGAYYDTREPYDLSIYLGGSDLGSSTLPKNELAGYGQNNQGTIYINEGVQTNPQFVELIDNGSTYNWFTRSPINFIHMAYDSAVTVVNSAQAYSCMKYGRSFTGDQNIVSSAAACTTQASGSSIESTVIGNAQLTNELLTWLPMGFLGNAPVVTGAGISRYWVSASSLISASDLPDDMSEYLFLAGIPFDHGDMFVLGNIVALCTFENMLANGTNSGVCPTLAQ